LYRKVCLPEFGNLVFFVYAYVVTFLIASKPSLTDRHIGYQKFGESENKRVANLAIPPGFEKCSKEGGFHGITKEKVVRSSKSYLDRFGNSRDPANLRNLTDFLRNPDSSMFSAGQPGV